MSRTTRSRRSSSTSTARAARRRRGGAGGEIRARAAAKPILAQVNSLAASGGLLARRPGRRDRPHARRRGRLDRRLHRARGHLRKAGQGRRQADPDQGRREQGRAGQHPAADRGRARAAQAGSTPITKPSWPRRRRRPRRQRRRRRGQDGPGPGVRRPRTRLAGHGRPGRHARETLRGSAPAAAARAQQRSATPSPQGGTRSFPFSRKSCATPASRKASPWISSRTARGLSAGVSPGPRRPADAMQRRSGKPQPAFASCAADHSRPPPTQGPGCGMNALAFNDNPELQGLADDFRRRRHQRGEEPRRGLQQEVRGRQRVSEEAKDKADQALTKMNELGAQIGAVEQLIARRANDNGPQRAMTMGEIVAANDKLAEYAGRRGKARQAHDRRRRKIGAEHHDGQRRRPGRAEQRVPGIIGDAAAPHDGARAARAGPHGLATRSCTSRRRASPTTPTW
jgi:hypothetical protein